VYNLGNNTNPSHVFLKGNTYYFNRHIPLDVREYYKFDRVILCLKTDRRDRAVRDAKSIAPRLEDYWLSLRLTKIDIPALHLLRDKPLDQAHSGKNDPCPVRCWSKD
jgi:hypothetical protein